MRTIKVFNIAPCLFLVLVLSFLVVSCTDEKITKKPKTGNGVMGLHNFNVSPGIVKGYVPQIMFFKQNEDGSFNCTFSGFTNWNSFETDWVNEYVLASFDQNGVVQTMTNMQYPSFDGSVANFGQGCGGQFWSFDGQNCDSFYRSRLSIDDNSVAFFNGSYDYSLGDYINKIFIVDVLNSNVKGISTINTSNNFTNGLFRTADGELLWAHSDDYYNGTLTYSIYSNTNELIFEESLPSYDLQNVYTSYLAKKNEDYFFYTLGDWFGQAFDYDPDFLDLLQITGPEPFPFEFEIRFGPGQSQKAHRFLVPEGRTSGVQFPEYTYQDYIDVPFEVWDVTNNRQIMVSFRDQGRDGKFNLIPRDLSSVPEEQSREYIIINPIEYSTIPDPTITADGNHGWGEGNQFFNSYLFWTALNPNITWDENNLPSSIQKLISGRPKSVDGKIIKVNANGITTVKENPLRSPVIVHNIFGAVSYNNGYAILCNTQQYAGYDDENLIPRLYLLDENFNRLDVQKMTENPCRMDQLETNGTSVFYSSISKHGDDSKRTIQLTIITDGVRKDRVLDEFIQFEIETYRITPTNEGGVALVAWVKPTSNTRDLLFLEFDSNLNLVK